jgi:hypothetical protein
MTPQKASTARNMKSTPISCVSVLVEPQTVVLPKQETGAHWSPILTQHKIVRFLRFLHFPHLPCRRVTARGGPLEVNPTQKITLYLTLCRLANAR